MRKKPLLNFWQLWNMSFGYVGIQFGFALQNANMSRIFETLGANIDTIPILWLAGPVSGMLVQPIIGHMSDKTWNRLGRRKPYFLAGALLSSMALIVMPNSPALWFAAGMMWILDSSINVTMQPFRAFIGDMLPDEQRTTGFAVQTFFIGASSIIASILPYLFTKFLHIANTAPEGQIPPSVRWSFYIGGIVYLLAVLWTIFSVKEYSPEEQDAFSGHETDAAAKEGADLQLNTSTYYTQGMFLIVAGLALSAVVWWLKWYQGLYILSVGIAVYGVFQIIAAQRFSAGKISGMVEIIYDLQNMPKVMTQLALVTILTWFALFAWWIYSTTAIASFHFHSDSVTYPVSGFKDAPAFAAELRDAPTFAAELKKPSNSVSVYLVSRFSEQTRQALAKWPNGTVVQPELQQALVSELNSIITGSSIWDRERFSQVCTNQQLQELGEALVQVKTPADVKRLTEALGKIHTPTEIRRLAETMSAQSPQAKDLAHLQSYLNRLLLDGAYPSQLWTQTAIYNEGANWNGVLMSFYNGVAAIVAFILPWMARKAGRVWTHMICLIIGGLGLISMFLFKDYHYLLISMTAIGIAWASLLTMPYAILSSAVPHRKMGVYMGMFNLFVVIPQILASASLGLIVNKLFHDDAIYGMVVGGAAMVAAGILMILVKDKMPDQIADQSPAMAAAGH